MERVLSSKQVHAGSNPARGIHKQRGLLMNMDPALTFDDVLLIPQLSDVDSRHNLSLKHGEIIGLDFPIISSNMDTVTEENMAIAMAGEGGMGIVHRFLSPKRLDQICNRIKCCTDKFGISVGINGDGLELLDVAVKHKTKFICVDVAHGHHEGVMRRIGEIRRRMELVDWPVIIIAGNVCTPEAIVDLAEFGADVIKIGVGPGSHCTTRVVTGHGYPQLSAILECSKIAKKIGVEVIADGGIRSSGDIAKALAAGADYVMVGRLLAGTAEAPGGESITKNGERVKIYRGMASRSAQAQRGRTEHSIIEEGVLSEVPAVGPVSEVLGRLRGGLASALSYSGAHSIKEFKKKARMIRVTHNSYIEGTPHGHR